MLGHQSSLFTGEIIPVYRTKHPHFQEKTSPFPGGIIPVSRRRQKKTSPFSGDCDKARIFKALNRRFLTVSRQSSPFSGPIIPIYRRIESHCSGGLIILSPFTGKSIIPFYRITKKYAPLRKHPRFQDGSIGLTINHPKITLTHGDDYPTLSLR